MRFGHNFGRGGPIDTRSTRLNCILQDFLGIPPLDYILYAQLPNGRIWAYLAVFGRVFENAKYGQLGHTNVQHIKLVCIRSFFKINHRESFFGSSVRNSLSPAKLERATLGNTNHNKKVP